MKATVKVLLRTMEVVFIVFFILFVYLLRWDIRVSGCFAERFAVDFLGTNLTLRVDAVSVGLMRGISLHGVAVYDRDPLGALRKMAGADEMSLNVFAHELRLVGATYPRLPDSYYAPENNEKNARVEATFPTLPEFRIVLERPNILGIAPKRVAGVVKASPKKLEFLDLNLIWKDEQPHMEVDGVCCIDLERQRVDGEVRGLAMQKHIRPLIVALDVPVALPYMDGFTEVPLPVPSFCGWGVNLINNDFDLELQLHPTLGKYNGVPMRKADGRIHLHVYTRGTCLNYKTDVGPIDAIDSEGRELHGTVTIVGTNRYNVVDIDARTTMPMADMMKIAGFEGDYMNRDVIGNTEGAFQFRFPRAMTNNYEVLNGKGHLSVRNGHVMKILALTRLFDKLPGIANLSEQDSVSADYEIDNGILKSNGIYVEGGGFTIKMYGAFDTVHDTLDYTARVDFARRDSVMGQVLQPTTWLLTKMFFEARLNGSMADPQWTYITPIDRILEAGGLKK